MSIELAVAGDANYLVSGDEALLRLAEHDEVTALSAGEFFAEIYQ